MIIIKCSHQRGSVKKGVLKNFANFIGKHLCWSLFLKNYMPVILFWRTTMNDCFWVITLTHIKPMFHSRRNQSIDPDCISIDCGFYMTLTLAWCGLRMLYFLHSNAFRSSHWRCSIKKVFLKMSQNSQRNACARASFIIKLQDFSCGTPLDECFCASMRPRRLYLSGGITNLYPFIQI